MAAKLTDKSSDEAIALTKHFIEEADKKTRQEKADSRTYIEIVYKGGQVRSVKHRVENELNIDGHERVF